jgi:hypothetical protein
MEMRLLLFWDVTQCRLVVSYQHFGAEFIFKGKADQSFKMTGLLDP